MCSVVLNGCLVVCSCVLMVVGRCRVILVCWCWWVCGGCVWWLVWILNSVLVWLNRI